MAFCAVVVAAGKSARFGGIKKEYRLLQGRPFLSRSLELFLSRPDCLACAAVVPPGGEAEARAVLGLKFLAAYRSRLLIVPGGEERSFSVLAGIKALADRLGEAADDTVALVHDGARPWASPALVQAVLDASAARGACVPALPVSDTIKEIDAADRKSVV